MSSEDTETLYFNYLKHLNMNVKDVSDFILPRRFDFEAMSPLRTSCYIKGSFAYIRTAELGLDPRCVQPLCGKVFIG